MVQEDVQQKTVALSIKASKLTCQVLAKALRGVLNKIKKSQTAPKQGRQTVKQLMKQHTGLSTVEINDGNIKGFERYARKYGIDFALKKDEETPPRWVVFFKARDADALTSAIGEFTRETTRREKRPSAREAMHDFKELNKQTVLERKPKHRERGERSGPSL